MSDTQSRPRNPCLTQFYVHGSCVTPTVSSTFNVSRPANYRPSFRQPHARPCKGHPDPVLGAVTPFDVHVWRKLPTFLVKSQSNDVWSRLEGLTPWRVELRAHLESISHRCHLIEVAFVWDLTKETIHLPLGCIQGGVARCVPCDTGHRRPLVQIRPTHCLQGYLAHKKRYPSPGPPYGTSHSPTVRS